MARSTYTIANTLESGVVCVFAKIDDQQIYYVCRIVDMQLY